MIALDWRLTVVSLLLLPTGRRAEPAVELHAPEGSLHLGERQPRGEAVTMRADAADTMRGSVSTTTARAE